MVVSTYMSSIDSTIINDAIAYAEELFRTNAGGLKSMMNTETGRQMAEKRHAFLEAFLEEYIAETS